MDLLRVPANQARVQSALFRLGGYVGFCIAQMALIFYIVGNVLDLKFTISFRFLIHPNYLTLSM